MSKSINILHLTDFHLNKSVIKDFDLLIRKPLIKDILKRANGNIDLLFITGDIVDIGGSDFEGLLKGLDISNEKVISQIAKDLNLKKESIFIIPGNHDINRDADKDFTDEGLKVKLKTPEKINEFIDDVNSGDFTGVERLEEYRNFEKKFYSDYNCKADDTFFHSTFIKKLNNSTVGISCLNSAWRCYSNKDDGNLLIGERQILESVKLIEDCNIKIALVHHHIDSLFSEEKDIIENILIKNYDLVFFGHSHKHKNYSKTQGGNQSIWVGSPSAFFNARIDSKKFSSGYSLCNLNIVNTEIQYSHFSYLNTDYRTNSEVGDNGYDKMHSVIKKSNTEVNSPTEKQISPKLDDLPKTVIDNKLNNIGKSSKLFTGRKDKLKELNESLQKNEIVSVTGIGGIGKTQLTLKFLEKFEKSRITWQEFTEESRFDTFIVASGFEMIIQSSISEKEKFSALVDKINEYRRIVIWDNFHDNHDETFLRFLDFSSNKLSADSKIIIVSRSFHLIKKFKSIKLIDFKESEEYAKVLIDERHRNLKLDDDEIKAICEYVKGHPLALELALNLCDSISYKKVIGKLAQHKTGVDELSQRIFEEILEQETTTSIEKEFLYKFSAFKGRVSETEIEAIFDEQYFYVAVPQLTDKYLIEYDSGYYDTHPLIREFCYEKLEDKKELHFKIASWLISQRGEKLNTLLEERIFYHLKGAHNNLEIYKTIEFYGRDYVREVFFEPLKEMIVFVEHQNMKNQLFDLLLGDMYELNGEYDKAISCFKKVFDSNINEELAVEGLLKYGNVLRVKGKTEVCLKFFNQAKLIATEKGFKKYIAWSLNNISLIKQMSGEMLESLKLKLEALNIITELLESSNDINLKQDISTLYNNIGSNYAMELAKTYDSQKALKYYGMSLDIQIEINYSIGISRCYNNIGNVYASNKFTGFNLEKGLEYYNKAVLLQIQIGDKSGLANTYNNISTIYSTESYDFHCFDTALKYAKQSFSISQEIDDKGVLSYACQNLTKIYFALKNYEECIDSVFKAYAINKILKAKNIIVEESINNIRKSIGLASFKTYSNKTYDKLSIELKNEIELKEFFNEPIRTNKTYGRNDRVKVKYRDGSVVTKKHKQVMKDIESGKCEIISE